MYLLQYFVKDYGSEVIVTPISHLSTNERFLDIVLAYGELEARDHLVLPKHLNHVVLHHSEFELQQCWSNSCKERLRQDLGRYRNLQAVSFHMVTCFPNYILEQGVAQGVGGQLSIDTMLKNASENCNWLKKYFPYLKILVENNNDLGSNAYDIVTDAGFISRIVLENDIHFLYDHAHAMISAYNKKTSLNNYVNKLPIHKLLQIHLSEPSFSKNKAIDSHNLPSTEQLEFCMSRFKNRAKFFTVEFYKSLTELESCLRKLRECLK